MHRAKIHGQILMNYTLFDMFPHKDVPFGGHIDIAAHLGG